MPNRKKPQKGDPFQEGPPGVIKEGPLLPKRSRQTFSILFSQPRLCCCQRCAATWPMENFKILNLNMKAGESVKIKGKACHNTNGFGINLGSSFCVLGLHLSPRFNPPVLVCNSRVSNSWQTEQHDHHVPFSSGSEVKFRVKLPDGHKIDFPNRHCYDMI